MGAYLQYPQYYGTPFYTNAQPGNSGIVNNGGVVLGVALNTLQNNRLFNYGFGYPYLGVRDAYNDNKPYISPSTTKSVYMPLSSGTFGVMTRGQYIMLGFTNQIAGVPNTLLDSPGLGYWRNSQNISYPYVQTYRKAQTGGWYYQNGKPVNPQFSSDLVSHEVNPTYASPGRLTYMQGAETALVRSYQAKTD